MSSICLLPPPPSSPSWTSTGSLPWSPGSHPPTPNRPFPAPPQPPGDTCEQLSLSPPSCVQNPSWLPLIVETKVFPVAHQVQMICPFPSAPPSPPSPCSQPHWPDSSSTAPLILLPQGLCTGCSLYLGTLFHQTPTWPPTQMSFLRHDLLREIVPDPLRHPASHFKLTPPTPSALPGILFLPTTVVLPTRMSVLQGQGTLSALRWVPSI